MTRLVVETANGKVAGARRGGVWVFNGMRYGADTRGERRFKPPLPPTGWAGVREAVEVGPSCPPTLSAADSAYFPTSPLWRAYAGVDEAVRYSEDCLTLNIWTPGPGGDRRPVFVWLHGGGFSWGSGSSPLTAGDALAGRHDAVVLTVNHRLGILGYLHLSDLAGGDWDGSGVAGLLDLQLALEWIRHNISAFGGDPNKVTIAGHSGGAAKVACLLALPSAKGLFHRAVIQSGPVLLRTVDRSEANNTAEQVLASAGVHPGDARRLQEWPVAALTKLAAEHRFRPVAGTPWLPAHPFDPVAVETAAGIPLLIGTTTHDTATFKFDSDPAFATLTEPELRQRVAEHPAAGFAERADEVIDAFARKCPDTSSAERLVAISSARLRESTTLVAERKLAGGDAPVFMYLFAYEVPMPPGTAFPGKLMAAHGFELPFVFDIADRIELAGDRPDRIALATLMSRYWMNFAREGTPNAPNAPHWPAYEVERRQNMVFDSRSKVENDPYADERILLARLSDTCRQDGDHQLRGDQALAATSRREDSRHE